MNDTMNMKSTRLLCCTGEIHNLQKIIIQYEMRRDHISYLHIKSLRGTLSVPGEMPPWSPGAGEMSSV